MTITSPIFTSSRTSKSTFSPALASEEDIVLASLIFTGVSSVRPNASGGFGVAEATGEAWLTCFWSLALSCEETSDEQSKHTARSGVILLRNVIVFLSSRSEERDCTRSFCRAQIDATAMKKCG